MESASLDERFKNLNYRPGSKLGMVLLSLICLVMLIPVQVAASGMIVFLLGIATIRLFGYRLLKAE